MNRTFAVHLSLFAVTLIYGAVFTIAKEVMPVHIGAFGLILLRIGISMLLFFVFHSLFIREKINLKEHFPRLLVCALSGVGVNMLLFFKGLSLTKPINGAVLMMFTPVFVVIFDALMNKEKISFLRAAGVMIACLGAMLLISGKGLSFNADTLAGDIMVIINAIIYAFYLVYVKSLIHTYHPVTVSKWTFLFGFIFVLPFGFGDMQEVHWNEIPPYIWACVAFIVVGSTFLTYLLNAWALRYAPSSLVGAYIYLQPILAMLIAVLAGKDELTLQKVLYTLLIFAGVYLVSQKAVKPIQETV